MVAMIGMLDRDKIIQNKAWNTAAGRAGTVGEVI